MPPQSHSPTVYSANIAVLDNILLTHVEFIEANFGTNDFCVESVGSGATQSRLVYGEGVKGERVQGELIVLTDGASTFLTTSGRAG